MVGVAVNVTLDSAQEVCVPAVIAILTLVVNSGFNITVMVFDVTDGLIKHGLAEEAITTVT